MFLSDRQQAVKQIKIVLRGGKNFTLLLGREFLRLANSGSSQKFCIQLRNSESCPTKRHQINQEKFLPPERLKINVVMKGRKVRRGDSLDWSDHQS